MKLQSIVFGTIAVTAVASAAFYFGTRYPSTQAVQSSPTVGATDSTGPVSGEYQAQAAQTLPVPTSSGHSYPAIDLLIKRPFPDQGQIVILDVAASPTVAYGRVLHYATYPGHIPSEAYARGVSFKQMLGVDICIYDVIEQVPGEGRTVPESAGQIAVQMQSSMGCPSAERIWNVEPTGVEEVTLNDGTVKQLPKVRFWDYRP